VEVATMKVSELIAVLSRCPQDADVGVSMTSLHGCVQAVRGVRLAKDGDDVLVCVDQEEHSLSSDELHRDLFSEVPS
jgi:hypothetical protein